MRETAHRAAIRLYFLLGRVNDALQPLKISVNRLPIKVSALGDMIAATRKKAAANAKLFEAVRKQE